MSSVSVFGCTLLIMMSVCLVRLFVFRIVVLASAFVYEMDWNVCASVCE